MELRHLRYFVAVAELENVSRAALRLHVSQPAVSRQIRDLEEELGVGLLVRSAKSVRLTDAGRSFLGDARSVLQRADLAVKNARAAASGRNGELNVGYAPTPTARMLPLLLRAFQAEMPGVRVRLHDLSTEEMLSGLRKGSLQVALLVRPSKAMLRGLTFVDIARDPASVAVPPGHPFARQRSVSVRQLSAEPLVAYNRKLYPEYHRRLVDLFKSVGKRPRIVEEHEGGASMVAAVEAGYGLALTTRSLGCSVGARLKILPITPEPPPIIVGAAWVKDRANPALRLFVDCATAAGKIE